MKRMEQQFSILFSDEQSPYFQVDSTLRRVLPLSELKGRTFFQKSFILFLFADHGQIDLTFLKSYANGPNKNFRSFEKQSLHHTIRIQNWREDVVHKKDDTVQIRCVTIQDIAASEVLAYIKSIARGKAPSFIAFYNDRYLLTVDSDELVVISKNQDDSNAVRTFIQKNQ